MSSWSERDSDWFEALPDDGPPTHEIVWTPTFRLKICLPPWVDPDKALTVLATEWNDDLGSEDADWPYLSDTDFPKWVTKIENDGSVQYIQEIQDAEATS